MGCETLGCVFLGRAPGFLRFVREAKSGNQPFWGSPIWRGNEGIQPGKQSLWNFPFFGFERSSAVATCNQLGSGLRAKFQGPFLGVSSLQLVAICGTWPGQTILACFGLCFLVLLNFSAGAAQISQVFFCQGLCSSVCARGCLSEGPQKELTRNARGLFSRITSHKTMDAFFPFPEWQSPLRSVVPSKIWRNKTCKSFSPSRPFQKATFSDSTSFEPKWNQTDKGNKRTLDEAEPAF